MISTVFFLLYIGLRFIGRTVFDAPLLWGGTTRSETVAIALVALFLGGIALGAQLAKKGSRPRLFPRPVDGTGARVGRVLGLAYVLIGTAALLVLLRRVGGLSIALANQAALPSQIKELGLGPYYGLIYLLYIALLVTAFRALVSSRWKVVVLSLLLSTIPTLCLGRRGLMLFMAFPLLTVYHYHVRRLSPRRTLILGTAALSFFVGVLLLRLNAAGSIQEKVFTSLEFAPYDALVAAIERRQDLQDYDLAYYERHPDDFWSSNVGAIFLQRIAAFRWQGGATPPTAVGVLYVYFGVLGLAAIGVLSGYGLARAREAARASPPMALAYGFLLTNWFDFMRDGDLVLGLKVLVRYAIPLAVLLLCYFAPTESADHSAPADNP